MDEEKQKIIFRLVRKNKITDEEAAILLKETVKIEYVPSYPYQSPWIVPNQPFYFTSQELTIN